MQSFPTCSPNHFISFKSTFVLSPYLIALGHRKGLRFISLTKGSSMKSWALKGTDSSLYLQGCFLNLVPLVPLSSFSLSSYCSVEVLLAWLILTALLSFVNLLLSPKDQSLFICFWCFADQGKCSTLAELWTNYPVITCQCQGWHVPNISLS